MGAKADKLAFRGDDDVKLTDLINSLTDDEFKAALAGAEENGILDSSDYANKSSLVSNLIKFDDAVK